jgi:hypothetical protein
MEDMKKFGDSDLMATQKRQGWQRSPTMKEQCELHFIAVCKVVKSK